MLSSYKTPSVIATNEHYMPSITRKSYRNLLLAIILIQFGYIVVTRYWPTGKKCACGWKDLAEYYDEHNFNGTFVEETIMETDMTPPKAKVIYTYYQSMSYGNIKQPGTRRMLKLWLRAWHREGYKPRILTYHNSTTHPRYYELRDAFERFPTVNNFDYEVACYLRWLAFRVVGGGTFMDYDILPLNRINFPNRIGPQDLSSCSHLLPMLTHAGAQAAEKIIVTMANYKGPFETIKKCPHISDMIIIRDHNREMYRIEEKGDGECKSMAHFSNYLYGKFRKDKWRNGDGGRLGLAADMHLLSIMLRFRVFLLTPEGVKINGKGEQYGLGLRERRVKELIAFTGKPDEDEDGIYGLFKDYSEGELLGRSKAHFINSWPLDYDESTDIVFVAFGPQVAHKYKDSEKESIKRYIEVIKPVHVDFEEESQLVIDYALGTASYRPIKFRYKKTEDNADDLDQILEDQFQKQIQTLKSIDHEVDRL